MKKLLSICSIVSLLFSCQNEKTNPVESTPKSKDSVTSSNINTPPTSANITSQQKTLTQVPSNLLIIATGSEPGWILNIYSDKYEFIGNYGKDTLRGERNFAKEQIPIYFTSSDLSFKIEKKNCIAMSGEKLELSVEVTYQNNVFKGCGKILK